MRKDVRGGPSSPHAAMIPGDRSPGSATDPGRRGAARHLGLVRLASWNVIDQVLSALTNAVLAVVVARTVSREEFGAFAVSFLVFSVSIGVMRALVGQPMGIRYSAATGEALRSGMSRALGTALSVAVIGAAVCVSAGLVLGGVLRPTLVATGAMLPALLLQDSCRLIFFARSNARMAAANDALWAVLEFSAIGLVTAAGWANAPLLVVVWGCAAAVCVVVALAQLGVVPRPFGTRSWLREHRDLWGYLLAEYLLGAGAFTGGILVVGALVGGVQGLEIIGAFRAAQVVLGPLGILATSLQTFSLPELAKRGWLTSAARWRVALAIGGLMCGAALAFGAVLLVLPRPVGTLLFRDNWDGAREVLLPLVIGQGAGGLCLGAALVIYSLGLARRTFRIMTVEAPLVFTLMIIGSRVDGAVGAAWGLCLDQVVLIPLWFGTLAAVLRDHRPAPDAAAPPAGQPAAPLAGQPAAPLAGQLAGSPIGPLDATPEVVRLDPKPVVDRSVRGPMTATEPPADRPVLRPSDPAAARNPR